MSGLTNFAISFSHWKCGSETILCNFRCPVFVHKFGIFTAFTYNVRTSAPQARFQNHTAANVVMEPKVLLIDEVAALLRISHSTIYRLISASRAGRSDFPAPISLRKGKSRWLASDIEHYLASQSGTGLPANFVSPAKKQKEYQRRQDAARATLARHGIHIDR